ncbi:twin-arginine translocation signal domain-containing protein, partial [Petrimonas sulfuriphila]
MQLNRRSFLKIAGAAGVGSMLTGKLTGSELPPQQQPPAKQLKSIYLEA